MDAAQQLLSLSQKELDQLPAELRQKIEVARKQVFAAKRLHTVQTARDDLLAFVEMSMPDPTAPDDPTKTRYQRRDVHEYIARSLEKVEKGEILRLIISVQPRVGKSELVSRKFPAWMMGRDPYKQIITATYGEELGKDFGREVRATMKSPFFNQVFPQVELRKNSQAADRLQTTAGGTAVFVGAGGTITGRGADCLPAGTLITTDKGDIAIEKIVASPYYKVLTYNHAERRCEYKDIEAVARRKKDGLRRITTAAGRVVEATSDHRIWTDRGYIRADQLTAGDSLLCAVPNTSHQASLRNAQTQKAGAVGVLLQQCLLGAGAKHSAVWREIVRRVRQARPESNGAWQRRGALLQQGVFAGGEGTRQNGNSQAQYSSVRNLFNAVCKESINVALLFTGLRQRAALIPYSGQEQPQMETRGNAAQTGTRGKRVSDHATADRVSGWAKVRSLFSTSGRTKIGSTSHQQRPHGQPSGQPSDTVQRVSSALARFGEFKITSDTVAVVERVRGEAQPVFDLQVADNHNFFANGILAHNCLLIDDPIKDAEEARSKARKDAIWEWYSRTAYSRLMGRGGAVVITMTRWAEDDLVGRLTEPKLGYVSEDDAKQWTVINIPAFAEADDPLGREPGEILWPDRTPKEFLESFRSLDPAGFAALYMGKPSPPEGNFITRDNIKGYQAHQLPSNLRYYAASDHAISQEQRRDSTCMGVVGVDSNDNIYILPDLVWAQLDAEDQVEAMMNLMRSKRPLSWWAEKGHISKSIGPFLRKRMLEEEVYCSIIEKTPVKDKQTRAQSIQARMSMGKVFFPVFAPWYAEAVEQMLNFPNGAHDDFVDFIAWIGIGLSSLLRADAPVQHVKEEPKSGSLEWILKSSDRIRKQNASTEKTARYLH